MLPVHLIPVLSILSHIQHSLLSTCITAQFIHSKDICQVLYEFPGAVIKGSTKQVTSPTQVHSLTVLEARSSKSRCRGVMLSAGSRGGFTGPFLAFGACQQPLVFLHLELCGSNLCFHHQLTFSLCVSGPLLLVLEGHWSL